MPFGKKFFAKRHEAWIFMITPELLQNANFTYFLKTHKNLKNLCCSYKTLHVQLKYPEPTLKHQTWLIMLNSDSRKKWNSTFL